MADIMKPQAPQSSNVPDRERRMMLGEYQWPNNDRLPLKTSQGVHGPMAVILDREVAKWWRGDNQPTDEHVLFIPDACVFLLSKADVVHRGVWRHVDNVINDGWLVD